MKLCATLFFLNLLSIIAVVAAGYLAAIGANGWGWFLFVAALSHVHPKRIKT